MKVLVARILDIVQNMKRGKRRVCVRCGTPVRYGRVSKGYLCYCPSCDEDLCCFETEVRNDVIGEK